MPTGIIDNLEIIQIHTGQNMGTGKAGSVMRQLFYILLKTGAVHQISQRIMGSLTVQTINDFPVRSHITKNENHSFAVLQDAGCI